MSRPITVTLDGQEYTLSVDFQTTADLAEELKLDPRQELNLSDLLRGKNFVVMLWACMGGYDLDLTPRQVGRLLTRPDDVKEIAPKVLQAFNEYAGAGKVSDTPNAGKGKGKSKKTSRPGKSTPSPETASE